MLAASDPLLFYNTDTKQKHRNIFKVMVLFLFKITAINRLFEFLQHKNISTNWN